MTASPGPNSWDYYVTRYKEASDLQNELNGMWKYMPYTALLAMVAAQLWRGSLPSTRRRNRTCKASRSASKTPTTQGNTSIFTRALSPWTKMASSQPIAGPLQQLETLLQTFTISSRAPADPYSSIRILHPPRTWRSTIHRYRNRRHLQFLLWPPPGLAAVH